MSLLERLSESSSNRDEMLRRFGFIPRSVISIGRGELSRRMFCFQREDPRRKTEKIADNPLMLEKSKIAGKKVFVKCKGDNTQTRRNAASVMPAELVDFFVKYYAEPGQTYLDPFMGQGIQMQVAKLRGMHYRGYDLCEEFYRYIEAVREKIDDGKTTIQCVLGDSRTPTEIPDGCGDFSFHSPPYWDIEDYGDDARQLGTNHTYEEFLAGMEEVARAWLPKFKPGAYHVVNVNDFRKGRRFYPYHADTISLFQRAGWELHDTWVVDGLVGQLPKIFAVDFNLKRIAPKTHEYCLVFRRPE